MKERHFNELVWLYGASERRILKLTEEQKQIVAKAWDEGSRRKTTEAIDEKINSYYADFINAGKKQDAGTK